jgi:hypothetical protein
VNTVPFATQAGFTCSNTLQPLMLDFDTMGPLVWQQWFVEIVAAKNYMYMGVSIYH